RGVSGARGLADAEYVGPLLDLLTEVRVRQRGVSGAVPQLHPWPRPGVPGVGAPDQVAPLLRRLDEIAARAGAVPAGAVGGGEAGERYAHERGARLEHVGV